jgi:hypothetical protein
VEFMDEGSATVAKEALHNYKLDGENKIKVCPQFTFSLMLMLMDFLDTRSHLQESRQKLFLVLSCTLFG